MSETPTGLIHAKRGAQLYAESCAPPVVRATRKRVKRAQTGPGSVDNVNGWACRCCVKMTHNRGKVCDTCLREQAAR
jgi:hypothetical protein